MTVVVLVFFVGKRIAGRPFCRAPNWRIMDIKPKRRMTLGIFGNVMFNSGADHASR